MTYVYYYQELITHVHGEAHKRKSADGRLEEYIRKNNENVEAQYVRTASAATREALRKAMANAPGDECGEQEGILEVCVSYTYV